MNLPSIKRAGSPHYTAIRSKTSFCSATYRPKAHRPIYRDLGALVHSKYLYFSVRHIALIVGAWSRSSSSGSTGEQQSGAPDASSGDGMIITKPGRTETSAPTPLSLASNRPRLETLSSLSGTGSSNPSPSTGESSANHRQGLGRGCRTLARGVSFCTRGGLGASHAPIYDTFNVQPRLISRPDPAARPGQG